MATAAALLLGQGGAAFRVVAVGGDGAVRVFQHVLGGAAQDGAARRARAARSKHDERRALLGCRLHDGLPRTCVVERFYTTVYLQPKFLKI